MRQLPTATYSYPDGVIDARLPGGGATLAQDWALQNTTDWLETVRGTVPQGLEIVGIDRAAVMGIGVDFTSCTILPVTAEGVPLCTLREYAATEVSEPATHNPPVRLRLCR